MNHSPPTERGANEIPQTLGYLDSIHSLIATVALYVCLQPGLGAQSHMSGQV